MIYSVIIIAGFCGDKYTEQNGTTWKHRMELEITEQLCKSHSW